MERIIRKTYDRERSPFATKGESLTHQSMAPECDINNIMKKWQRTGIVEHRNTFDGQYGDFINVPTDYHEAMNQVLAADEMFSALPSSVRKRFGNDPANFLEFVADPENEKELVKLGLATEKVLETKPEVAQLDPADKPKVEKPAPKSEKIDDKA